MVFGRVQVGVLVFGRCLSNFFFRVVFVLLFGKSVQLDVSSFVVGVGRNLCRGRAGIQQRFGIGIWRVVFVFFFRYQWGGCLASGGFILFFFVGVAFRKMYYYRYFSVEVSCWYKYLFFSYNIVFWVSGLGVAFFVAFVFQLVSIFSVLFCRFFGRFGMGRRLRLRSSLVFTERRQ